MSGPCAGLLEFGAKVEAAIGHNTDFVQKVVIHRRVFAILEDPLVHPYKWLGVLKSLLHRFSAVILRIR